MGENLREQEELQGRSQVETRSWVLKLVYYALCKEYNERKTALFTLWVILAVSNNGSKCWKDSRNGLG